MAPNRKEEKEEEYPTLSVAATWTRGKSATYFTDRLEGQVVLPHIGERVQVCAHVLSYVDTKSVPRKGGKGNKLQKVTVREEGSYTSPKWPKTYARVDWTETANLWIEEHDIDDPKGTKAYNARTAMKEYVEPEIRTGHQFTARVVGFNTSARGATDINPEVRIALSGLPLHLSANSQA